MKNIGKYQIIRRLGKGGMGAVYKGLVPEIEKVVAIKLLAPSEIMEDIIGYEKLREIFLTEARTMASFHQPFLVTAHDWAEDEQGHPFFVMEYICKNFGDMIGEQFQVEEESRIIAPEKVLYYGHQLLEALAFLHHNNIVHRDIKPQNILVTDEDTIKICDFGMALVDGVAFNGPANMQVGSPFYTPPEQRTQPLEVDGRADLYSAAVMLYRMLTGKLPGMQSFSLSMVNPMYDQKWDDFFTKALSWDADLRFQSAGEMITAMAALHIDPKGQNNTACSLVSSSKKQRLRREPINVCKSRAGEAFDINQQSRPNVNRPTCLTVEEEQVVDNSTGLIWKRKVDPYPLSKAQAVVYIDDLNKGQNKMQWRLPTVNELLSLLGEHHILDPVPFIPDTVRWLWSCDKHGKYEGWYVNLDMGYAGTQDVHCLNYVVPVCSMENV